MSEYLGSNNTGYWYNFGTSGVSQLPPQALPTSRKNKKWERANMDALEQIGLKQIKDNLKFKDIYRMIEGKLAYTEIRDTMPMLREVGDLLDDFKIPSNIKHYDILGIIINALVGEYLQNTDKFTVTNTDEISGNEYTRKKSELLNKYIKEEIGKEIQLRMMGMGINPNPEQAGIKTQEELEAYMQKIQQTTKALTPPEIEHYMKNSWKTKGEIWGQHTIENDHERWNMVELDRDNLIDFLGTGRCFRHFRVGHDFYRPEYWSPLNTFYSRDLETKRVEKGDYVGRIHFYTPSQFIDLYGHKLTANQKKELLGGSYEYVDAGGGGKSAQKIMENNFHSMEIVPHKQYHDYNTMLDIQDTFGFPVAETTLNAKDGSVVNYPTFLSERFNGMGRNTNLAKNLSDDPLQRTDLLQVTEAYFVSYQKVGYLTYERESGGLTSVIVTDELLTDYIKENEIKQLNTVTLEEAQENPRKNTIVWDYVKQIYQGTKVNPLHSQSEALYLGIEPLEFQIKGDSEVFDLKLPVTGLVDYALANKIMPFQQSHNVFMNQAYQLAEKEIGMFFIFDINFLPSEFKEWGSSEETLMHMRNLVKDVGLMPLDTTKQNLQTSGSFNQFGTQDLSYGRQIAEKLNIADSYKMKAFEQIGLTPQRLGSPVKYETAEGVRQGVNASYAQTEIYFDKFSSFKKDCLDMHLSVAQWSQANNKDISVFYTKSDQSKAFLKFSDENFSLRQLGIRAQSNAKSRKDLENFKNYLMTTNTLGADEVSLVKLFSSDSVVELMEAARMERKRRESQTEAQRQHEMGVVQAQAKAQEEAEVKKWEREEFSKDKDRDTKIQVERIEALGRAADNNANTTDIDMINKSADLALRKQKQDTEADIEKEKLTNNKQEQDRRYNLDLEKLKLQVEDTRRKVQESKDKRYIAEINKN